jgi:hypothetical protein
MNSNELKSTPTPFWFAFATSLALLVALMVWWNYTPGQDHIASISLNGDATWYLNYEIGFEIQEQEILYHGIGNSIPNAQQADIIFLGWSRQLFAIDWQIFDEFERTHHVKMFNLGLAGLHSGEMPLRIIRKHGLRPKLWIINADRDLKDFRSGFFYMTTDSGAAFGRAMVNRVISSSRNVALRNVLARNVRWRLKMALGLLPNAPYRSARSGNWFLENWPRSSPETNSAITLKGLSYVDGVARTTDRVDFTCPAAPEEFAGAREYAKAIGGEVILIQVPSSFACAERVHELASALGAPVFTVDPTQFTSYDGGGHLDRIGARKYSTMFFDWLAQLPEFQRLFPK